MLSIQGRRPPPEGYDERISNSFYVQMSEQWKIEQDRIEHDITRHQAADRSYLDEGARLIEVMHGALRLFAKQSPAEQKKLLNFVLSNSTWKDGELTPTFRQPFDLIAETAATARASSGEDARNLEGHSGWLSFVNTYRTILLAPSGEILSLFEMVKSFRGGGVG